MPDRRVPGKQTPRVDGCRSSDPRLTTRACADRLGVSTDFIIGEIREGRLQALVLDGRRSRAIYRISEDELAAYMIRYRWNRPTVQKPPTR